MSDLPTWDELDALVDTDPIKLRDVTWELQRRLEQPAPTPSAARCLDVANWRDGRTGTTEAWRTFADANGIRYPERATRGRIITNVQRWLSARDDSPADSNVEPGP